MPIHVKPSGVKERNGTELRERARSKTEKVRVAARAELRRRRDNLRDAVVPGWEKAARGDDPSSWKLW